MHKRTEINNLRNRIYRLEQVIDLLGRNGVVTSINKLNKEVFEIKKPGKYTFLSSPFLGLEDETPTLAGKVDAIIEHLNLKIEVQPERTTSAVITAKKITKKGKK